MKVTREKTENNQAFLTIEMEPAEVEESLEKSYRRLVKKVNIPGFRRGKAPRAVLEQHIGREGLLDDAVQNMLPEVCEKAIKEQEIEAGAQPQVEIAGTDPVVFKAIVPLPPVIKLGDYRGIRMTQEPVEVTEEKVDSLIEQLRHQHAIWEPVERPVDFGDMVVLDIESSIEGEPFINRKGVQYQVLRDAPFPAPGFAEQLSGMNVGENKEFKLQLPADYARSELAGKEAWFKVEVGETKQEKLPEVNDEFARQIGPDFQSVDSLRERVVTNLRLNAEEEARRGFEQRLVEAAVDLAAVEFPPVFVDVEVDRMINEQARRWQMSGRGLEDYLKSINKTGEELREELLPIATKRVKESLVLGKIAEEEKIEVSDSDIGAEIERMTTDAAENKDKLNQLLNTPRARHSVEQLLLTRKTIERLVEIAEGSDTDKPAEEKEEQT